MNPSRPVLSEAALAGELLALELDVTAVGWHFQAQERPSQGGHLPCVLQVGATTHRTEGPQGPHGAQTPGAGATPPVLGGAFWHVTVTHGVTAAGHTWAEAAQALRRALDALPQAGA